MAVLRYVQQSNGPTRSQPGHYGVKVFFLFVGIIAPGGFSKQDFIAPGGFTKEYFIAPGGLKKTLLKGTRCHFFIVLVTECT